MSTRENIKQAARVLHDAEAVLITAGAGMGVDSGLPDFRGKEGFWKAYPPLAKLGKSFVEMANPEWFYSNPKLAWAFYGHRLNLYRKTIPHSGFDQLLEIVDRKPGGYFVFTSNVDGHFQKAGYEEARIEECHGSIHYLQCTGPCGRDIWDAGKLQVPVDEEVFEALEPLPRCIKCGGMARPNILMFGDWSWNGARSQDQGERLALWLKSVAADGMRPAIVEMGAGTAVATVRWKSEQAARRTNGVLIRINPRDTMIPSGPHLALPLGAAEAMAAICTAVKG
jgi:NAD-dependent SIR2 family protein deacetylase